MLQSWSEEDGWLCWYLGQRKQEVQIADQENKLRVSGNSKGPGSLSLFVGGQQ